MKKSEQVAGGDAAATEEARRKVEEEKKKAEAGRGINLKAFKDRGIRIMKIIIIIIYIM